MKKKIFAIFCITLLSISVFTGCGKEKTVSDNTVTETSTKDSKFVIENDNVKVANYKGIEIEPSVIGINPYDEITDEQVQAFINYNLEYYYSEEETIPTYADLTDEMVANLSYGEYIHVDDYVEFIRNLMMDENKELFKEYASDYLFRNVVEDSVLKDYTDEDLQEYIDYANEYFTEYAQSLNVSFETYRKENLGFETQEEYDNYIKEEALANLKTKFIIEAIAEEENITISQEEIEEEINNYITYNGFENKEAVLEFVTEDEIVVNLKYYKVMDLIYSESVLITTNN